MELVELLAVDILADVAADVVVAAEALAEAVAGRLGYCSGGLDTN